MSPEISFEKAFERLEQILEMMNEGKTPLQESLSLFEEAEKLIRSCTNRLTQAEQKVEMLIKSRSGETQLDANQKPQLQPYTQQIAPIPQPVAAKPAPAPASVSMDELPF
ncbi:MAG: exodeoxyribonuclease VII small subunit [Chlamydiae bacterium]|nr:exodeoxyribonuclease VII small subunit [Chlamydiota bacterium]